MALATSIAGWVNVGLMLITLRRRAWIRMDGALLRQIAYMLAACLLMMASLSVLKPYVQPWGEQGEFMRFSGLIVLVAGGAATYFLGGCLLNILDCRRRCAQLLGMRKGDV